MKRLAIQLAAQISPTRFSRNLKSGIYIADISTVTLPNAPRPCANPNVLFELGYAIAQVGWDRTVLLLNKAIGKFPTDLPFDISQNRVSSYEIAPGSGKSVITAKTKELQSLLEKAIQIIIDKNPKAPHELRGLSREKIRHERDVESLNLLFSRVHIETIQQHIEELPRRILGSSFLFWEDFKGIVTSDSFHIYDRIIEENICDLFTNWQNSYRFVERYHDAGDNHVFSNPGDSPLDPGQQKDWDKIEETRNGMETALRNLLERVREAFVEGDTKKLSDGAWRNYVHESKAFKSRWNF